MALCPACKSISVPALICELDHVPDWWERLNSKSKPRGMLHHTDARQLPLSAAAGCPLCAMMRDAILRYDRNQVPHPHRLHQEIGAVHRDQWDIDQFESRLINHPIYLKPNYDPRKGAFPQDEVANAPQIRGFKVFVPADLGILTAQIRLFAPRDSSAAVSCDVVGRPSLPSSDSPQAFSLISLWMSTCLAKHGACRETVSGVTIDESSPPILPTRIIHIGHPDGEISPRLMEAQGKTGHYCALSHCWGPHKPPLMTTQSTLKSRLAGIPWNGIPKAYQDAITATHRLGFEYIWIDSLCIVQDSHDDWLYESKRMGSVYEDARLTIAASHASDSSQPCFFPRSPPPASVELPYISQTGECDGSVFATLMPDDYKSISPELGPLAARAWATQEWLLSRRMIFYTADCLVWSCKEVSQRETGGSFHDTARNPRWKNIVEKYSARSLTQAGDRLIALEGLRTEMGKRTANDSYCLGLWKNSLPDQLLWFCCMPAERINSPLGLPSWTWASTMYGVRFLDIKKAKNACKGFQFDEANDTLIIHGALRMATLAFPFRRSGSDDTSAISRIATHTMQDGAPSNMMCAMYGNDDSTAGWGVLDEGSLDTDANVFCLQLMKHNLVDVTPGGAKQKYFRQCVLLLQRVHSFAEAYERVGVGVIISAAPWFEDVAPTRVYVR